MSGPLIAVVDGEKGYSWPGRPRKEPQRAQYLPLSKVLTTRWAFDARFMACSVPAIQYKLRKEAVRQLTDPVPMTVLALDVDAHEVPEAEREIWWLEQRVAVGRVLEEHPGGFCYRTRGGYRLIWTLEPPQPISDEDGAAWQVFYLRIVLHLWRAFGIQCDPQTSNWTRIWRAPHATRDSKTGPEEHETIGDPEKVGAWSHEPGELAADIASARELVLKWEAEHPGKSGNVWTGPLRRLEDAAEPKRQELPKAPQVVSAHVGESARAKKALEAICQEVASSVPPGRNQVLNRAALKLGHYVCSGELTESMVRRELHAAAQACGLVKDDGADSVASTIQSGLERGKKDPPSTPLRQGTPSEPRMASQPRRAAVPAPPADLPPLWDEGEADAPEAPPPLTWFRLTDLGNAERMIARHGASLRYCHPWSSWLAWDGARWKVDDTAAVYRMAIESVRSMYVDASRVDERKVRDALIDHARKSEARTRIEAAVGLARGLEGVPVLPDALDGNPWLLNCENGTLNLLTGKLEAHRREDLSTKLCPVKYDEKAECPRWLSFLERIIPDVLVRGFLQRFCGYCLTGVIRERILVFLYGSGANGKSVFLSVMRHVLGEYAGVTSPDLLMSKRGDSHPTDVADLVGVRFAVCSEVTEGRRFDEEAVKRLTGKEPVKARRMRQDFFEFEPTWKLVLAANHRPPVRDTTDSIWDRIRQVPFEVRIPPEEQDRELFEKLCEEAPGILRWAVEGCIEWQKWGLKEPPSVMAATADYRGDQDVVPQFLTDCCELLPGECVRAADLYDAFRGWSHDRGDSRPMSQKRFAQRLEHVDGITNKTAEGRDCRDGKGRTMWRGLRLTTLGLSLLNLWGSISHSSLKQGSRVGGNVEKGSEGSDGSEQGSAPSWEDTEQLAIPAGVYT
jgi:putative DNA primase/helicase